MYFVGVFISILCPFMFWREAPTRSLHLFWLLRCYGHWSGANLYVCEPCVFSWHTNIRWRDLFSSQRVTVVGEICFSTASSYCIEWLSFFFLYHVLLLSDICMLMCFSRVVYCNMWLMVHTNICTYGSKLMVHKNDQMIIAMKLAFTACLPCGLNSSSSLTVLLVSTRRLNWYSVGYNRQKYFI